MIVTVLTNLTFSKTALKMSARSNGVSVFVRTRPSVNFAQDLIEYLPDQKTINIHMKKDTRNVVNNQQSDWAFKMDGVLHNVSQSHVYEMTAKNVVLRALDGYNGTVMCYGQTGAGKTYTMTGATENYKQRGIIPRALQQIFRETEERSEQAFTVWISFLEIYNETLFDLLSTLPDADSRDSQMAIVDDGNGVRVKGLSVHLTNNEEEALNLLFEGETNRIIASHALNKNSSRSHCILTVYIESRSRTLSNAKYVTSKLNLVDLAGSERLGKTGSEGQVLREAMYINKSLSFLEQAIIALADHRRDHIPFRQSKLTYALKDSLGGNCNTVLVANIYEEAAQIEETLSTLRFATRMKCVQTEPAVNEHIDPVLQVKKLEMEIRQLKNELAIHDSLANRSLVSYDAMSDTQIADINFQVHRYLEGTTDEIEIVNIRQIQEVFAQFKVVLHQQEQEIEAKIRQKYTLIDRSDSAAIAAAVKAGHPVDMVGEVDGQGFGIGVAPSAAKHSGSSIVSAKKAKMKKGKEMISPGRKDGLVSPGDGKEVEMGSLSKMYQLVSSTKDLESKEHDVHSIESHRSESACKDDHSRPNSPPPKSEAFEDFKSERGSEINRILKENKSILLEKRKKVKELMDIINYTKEEIDSTKQALLAKKQDRQLQGQYVNEEGETVIDEEEFDLIMKLKELKTSYRSNYDALRNTKAEDQYCQRLVEQCRSRLLTEFESWYNESYLIPEEVQNALRDRGSIRPGMMPLNRVLALEEDEQERFERLHQELLSSSPGSISFYNAHMRTQQRKHCFRARSQAQPQRKRAGVIVPQMKNKPPSILLSSS
ncbi:kinesin-like protein KIF9 isoform X1 [Acipenser oxyrinchus oxyrinchus]|uniref:Kinesin-like protein n=1 Tax=Acipenser oxyrinchus oxyrinchus TaxID=40147 RepID=A0AAD8LR82_ACIOX|nr:kinesin-like protein KIF9 isoform X1 [Acipenser oxyrinchus oxyrinchus]